MLPAARGMAPDQCAATGRDDVGTRYSLLAMALTVQGTTEDVQI